MKKGRYVKRKYAALVRMPRPEASTALLELLDDLRGYAMEGKIRTFVLVATLGGGEGSLSSTHLPEGEDLIRLLGHIRRLEHRVMEQVNAAQEEME